MSLKSYIVYLKFTIWLFFMSDFPNKDFVVDKINEWFDSTAFIRNLYMYIKDNKWEEELYKYLWGITWHLQ